jgi:bifunctional NMN adenylyltransferase/nudix hydrolase
MEKEFDLLVFVGRFQPFHNEHKRIIDIALEKSKNVLVLVGSAGKARTIRNPFTFQERKDMIRGSYFLNQAGMDDGSYDRNIDLRLIVKPLYDKTYNDAAWIKQVQTIVLDTALDVANNGSSFRASGYNDITVGLIGASKDNTSYYLKMFPQFKSVNVEIENDVHATDIREAYLNGDLEWGGELDLRNTDLPYSVKDFLYDFYITDEYNQLASELKFVLDYKKQWEAAPYPVKHATVDAVVEQSGHILLVKRKAEPGKGLWALPGGHLNEYEKQLDGAIRELREETKIKVPEAVLRGSIRDHETFDDPYRSTLGRVITKAYHFKLADDVTLPKVKGADDAEKAKWVPISELREEDFFDDHYFIIQYFLGL